jgi:hypothetical protein
MATQRLIGGPRKKIAAPAQRAPVWPVVVEVDYIDGEETVDLAGLEAVIDGAFLKITEGPAQQLFVRLETVRTFRVRGAVVVQSAPQMIGEDARVPQPAPQGPPREYSPLKEARARMIKMEVKGGGEVPASVIVNSDGSTEVVEANMT